MMSRHTIQMIKHPKATKGLNQPEVVRTDKLDTFKQTGPHMNHKSDYSKLPCALITLAWVTVCKIRQTDSTCSGVA